MTTAHTPAAVQACDYCDGPYIEVFPDEEPYAVTVCALHWNAPAMLDALREIERFAEVCSSGYGHDPDTDVARIARMAAAIIDRIEAQS